MMQNRTTIYLTLACCFLLISILLSCDKGNNAQPTENNKIDTWASDVQLTVLKDMNPDPKIVEINLEAKEIDIEIIPGEKTQMYTYNGLFPGPLIEANIGDTLIVHFTNRLSEETTVHWHGVEVPAVMDGSNISQLPIAANGGQFTYRFKLLTAATYWYHPHIQTHRQVEKGLYGALVVRDIVEDSQLKLPTKELVVVLDDILFDENKQVAPAYPADPVQYASVQLNGREGDVMLVNGKIFPTVKVIAGEPIRLRFINAANARFFRFSINNKFYRIGGDAGLIMDTVHTPPIPTFTPANKTSSLSARHFGDGDQLYSNPDLSFGVMLVPGERADTIFIPDCDPKGLLLEDKNNFLEWHDFPRGRHSAERKEDGSIGIVHDLTIDGASAARRLMTFECVSKESAPPAYKIPEHLRDVEKISVTENTPILPITFGHTFPDSLGNITFFATMVDGVGKPFELLTPEQGLSAIKGQVYVWEVTNLTEGDHPFHPHGFSFQLLGTSYIDMDTTDNNFIELPEYLEYKDTIRIPGRPGARGRSRTVVRLAVKFDDIGREGRVSANGKFATSTTSGGWIVHCHILEHTNRGMMTFLNLFDP